MSERIRSETARGSLRAVLLLLLWLCGLAAGVAYAIDDHEPFDDPALQARFEKLTEELRCVKCQNNNIADSNADIARDLRRQVHEMLAAGRTDREILDFMVNRYGDFVLYRPAFKPSNYLLWLAPALMMVGGVWVLVSVIRSRAALLDDEDEGADAIDGVAGAEGGAPGGSAT